MDGIDAELLWWRVSLNERGSIVYNFDWVKSVFISVIIVVVLVVVYWAGGGYSYIDGYTINACTTVSGIPGPNTYHQVIEVRANGQDRIIFSTLDIDEALMVLNEFECGECGD